MLIELFKHILHLDFEWLFSNFGTYIYLILFLVIFIETGLVVMPFLPGDSLLFTAGLFARLGYLNISYLLLLLFIAAVLGDNVNYFIGKNIGLKMLQLKIKGKVLVKQQYIDQTHLFYEKHGPKTIIMARFVPIVRTFAPFVAGLGSMTYKRFISFCVLGNVVWICLFTLAGYAFGNIEFVKHNFTFVILAIIGLSLMPMVIGIIKHKYFSDKTA